MKRNYLSIALLIAAALGGCPRQKPADAADGATPPAGAATPAAGSLGALLAGATAVKVTARTTDAAGKLSSASYGVSDAAEIRTLIAAVGEEQAPEDACLKCLPSHELAFEAGGVERATIGLFCGQDATQPQRASLHTSAGGCQSVTLKDPTALKQALERAKAASK
jgi:hypothetical protein